VYIYLYIHMISNCSIISQISGPELYNLSNLLIKNAFICSGVFLTSSLIAIFITSRILLNNLENEYKLIYGYDSDEEEFFNSKYLHEYYELKENTIEDFDILKDKIIKEKTPDGLVYLGYDFNKEAFFYYSDFKDIAYNYLEVCARKFVIEYDCKLLLLNTKEELIKVFKTFANNETEDYTNSIFAKLKTEDVNKKESIDHKLRIKTKQLPVPEKCNRFVYKGKLYNFNSDSDDNKKESTTSECIDIDYKTFKNKMA
jgi:hypothetical protein